MNLLRRLPHAYCIVVACAVLVFVYQATGVPPSTGKTVIGLTPIGWQPSAASVIFWAVMLATLAFTPWYPCVGLSAYVLTEYSCYRYGPELEFVYMQGLTEWIALGAAIGTAIWWQRQPRTSKPLYGMVGYALAGLVLWALMSAFASIMRQGDISFEPQHHPLRYVNGLLLYAIAAVAIRRPSDMLFVVTAFLAAIVWRHAQSPQTIPLDGDLAGLAAMALPLTIGILCVQSNWYVRGMALLASTYLAWLLVTIQSRGAVAAGLAGLLMLWMQSRLRWWVLLAALPIFGLGYAVARQNGLYERIRGSLPGGAAYESVESRFALWELAWRTSLNHPLLGVGPGEYAEVRRQETGRSAKAAHNNFFAVLAELGFPGLILYVVLFGSAMVLLVRGAQTGDDWSTTTCWYLAAAITAYLTGGMFLTRQDQAFAYILLGAGTAALNLGKGRLVSPQGQI